MPTTPGRAVTSGSGVPPRPNGVGVRLCLAVENRDGHPLEPETGPEVGGLVGRVSDDLDRVDEGTDIAEVPRVGRGAATGGEPGRRGAPVDGQTGRELIPSEHRRGTDCAGLCDVDRLGPSRGGGRRCGRGRCRRRRGGRGRCRRSVVSITSAVLESLPGSRVSRSELAMSSITKSSTGSAGCDDHRVVEIEALPGGAGDGGLVGEEMGLEQAGCRSSTAPVGPRTNRPTPRCRPVGPSRSRRPSRFGIRGSSPGCRRPGSRRSGRPRRRGSARR